MSRFGSGNRQEKKKTVIEKIKCVDADFDSREVEKHYIFPIDQKFIMDKERKIHIYDE